jgi:hypothetical protein
MYSISPGTMLEPKLEVMDLVGIEQLMGFRLLL